MGGQNVTSEGRLLTGVLVAFAVVALLAAVDLASDLGEGTTVGHVLAEGGLFVVGLLGATVMARRLRDLAAFFLEDLLLPHGEGSAKPA